MNQDKGPSAEQRDTDKLAEHVFDTASAVMTARVVPPVTKNSRLRDATLEMYALADRAGIPIGIAVYQSVGDRGAPSLIHVQGGPAGGHMSLDEACDLALFNGTPVTNRYAPTESCPHTSLKFRLRKSDVLVNVICEPTWEQVNQ